MSDKTLRMLVDLIDDVRDFVDPEIALLGEDFPSGGSEVESEEDVNNAIALLDELSKMISYRLHRHGLA